MARKQVALLAALLGVATPTQAFDTRSEAQTVIFYYAIPLGAHTVKDRMPWLGMQINGKRDYQSYRADTRLFTFNFAEAGAAEANLVAIGAIAIGAAVAVAARGKSSQEQVQQQQQAQAAQPPATTPTPCATACPK
jgi:hypothetical protein